MAIPIQIGICPGQRCIQSKAYHLTAFAYEYFEILGKTCEKRAIHSNYEVDKHDNTEKQNDMKRINSWQIISQTCSMLQTFNAPPFIADI